MQKLGIKPGFCILVAGAPVAYGELVGRLPEQATTVSDPRGAVDMVHLFATEAATLCNELRRHRDAIAPDGMMWVSWPKKSSGVPTDLTDRVVRQTALALGLVDVKVCAIDDTWSGLKLVIPKDRRARRTK